MLDPRQAHRPTKNGEAKGLFPITSRPFFAHRTPRIRCYEIGLGCEIRPEAPHYPSQPHSLRRTRVQNSPDSGHGGPQARFRRGLGIGLTPIWVISATTNGKGPRLLAGRSLKSFLAPPVFSIRKDFTPCGFVRTSSRTPRYTPPPHAILSFLHPQRPRHSPGPWTQRWPPVLYRIPAAPQLLNHGASSASYS